MAERRYREEQIKQKATKRRRRKRRKKHGSLLGTVLLVFLVCVLLVGGTLFYLSNRMLSRIERVDKSEEVWIPPAEVTIPIEIPELPEAGGEPETPSADTITPESVQWTAPVKAAPKPKVKNILLIGQDRRPGEDRARSDVMILCSLNEDTREISLISFMRDMYVPFPGDYEPSRMNHSFAWGGMSLLDQLIEEDFGITIDGNVVIDFNGFISAMNLIAPLNIELKSYEVGYFNTFTDWGLHVGVNALNGEQLLAYARLREMGHGDWERTERQRTVLQAAFQKVKNLSLKELTDLANAALPCFSTDMSNTDIMNLIYAVVTNRMTIAGTYRLPIDGSYSEEIIYGMAVLVPDLEANSAYLHRCIYGS